MYKKSKSMCFFFDKNNKQDFINKIINSEKMNVKKYKNIEAMKYSKEFTLFSHYKNLSNLIR